MFLAHHELESANIIIIIIIMIIITITVVFTIIIDATTITEQASACSAAECLFYAGADLKWAHFKSAPA